jgi:LysR family transcriptional regulator, regulator for bpeEF and oprC
MDLDSLRDFLAVVHEGSFAGAAKLRRTPKSTVSKRVQDLEAALGVRLLERTTRALRLTAEGQLLAERGARIAEEADAVSALFQDRAGGPKGHLRVSSPHLFGQIFMGQIAAQLLARHPDLSLEVMFRDGPVDLIEEGLDCAIRLGELEPSTLIARRFVQASNVLAAAPDAARSVKRIEDLDRVRTISYASQAAAEWTLSGPGGAVSAGTNPHLRLGGMLAVKAACVAGAGVAMLPSFLIAEELADKRLVRVLPAYSGPSPVLSIVYPSARHLSPRIRAFVDCVAAAFPGGKV